MECKHIEARALKSSFKSDLAVKSSQQVLFDDFFCVDAFNGVSSDDFSVDVFLDLSNNDLQDGFVGEESQEEEKDSVSFSSQDRVDDFSSNSSIFSGSFGSGSLLDGELPVPDDLEDLEWLSRFVDDSDSKLTLMCPVGDFKEKTGGNFGPASLPAIQGTPFLCFPTPVRAKARSKRARPSGRVWSSSTSSLTESSSISSSTSYGSSTSSITFSSPVRGMASVTGELRPLAKKQKRRPATEAGGESAAQRHCSHCLVQKTPQWRTGPLGAKTLCNACGIRYKSGRLFPEYRPACSPTFSGEVHSNSHRKVLEMRWKKETADTGPGLAPNPQIFGA